MKGAEFLKLKDISHNEDKIHITFVSYLKEDFVERLIKITVNDKKIIEQIYFSSNQYGTAYWVNGRGITECHRWEDEDSVQSISTLSRHYTALLLNGEVTSEFALKSIIPDVLNFLEDGEFAEYIDNIIKERNYEAEADLQKFLHIYN